MTDAPEVPGKPNPTAEAMKRALAAKKAGGGAASASGGFKPGQHEEISFHGEAISNIAEELLVGVAARQVHAHTACVTQNNRPDLE